MNLLGAFDLTAKADAKSNRLSGGVRRRLLIVRALVHRPRLLILDEPTAGVDLKLRRELWSDVRLLHQQHDMTVPLTTRYLEEPRSCASAWASSATAGSSRAKMGCCTALIGSAPSGAGVRGSREVPMRPRR